jgi:cytochrome P450
MIVDNYKGAYLALIAIFIAYVLFFVLSGKKKSYPVVSGLLATMNAINEAAVQGVLPQLLNKWTDQLGSVYGFQLFAMHVCVVSDPDLITQMFNQSALFPSRGQTGMTYFIPESLLGYRLSCPQWKMHRKILSGAFTDNCLKKYADVIVMVGDGLVQQLREQPVVPNINALMANKAYLVLVHTVLGGEAWLKHFAEVGSREEMEAVMQMVSVFTFLPTQLWGWVSLPGRAVGDGFFQRNKTAAEEVIGDIRANNRQGNSIMHFLIHHDSGLSDKEIMEELMSFVMAGHETTANTLSFAFIALALHPEIQSAARGELNRVLQGRPFTYECIARLPYIWSIIRETLRYFPTVPFTFRDCTADTRLGAHHISTGTRVLVNMMHVCHNPEYFKNPDTFDPQRWMDACGGTIDSLKNHDVTRNFGGGLRMCIGKRFSEEEQVILLAMVLSQFSVSAVSVGGSPVVAAGLKGAQGGTKGKGKVKEIALRDIRIKTNITMTSEEAVSLRFTPHNGPVEEVE